MHPFEHPTDEPISRDHRTYACMAMASLVGLVCVALMGGIYLKTVRKAAPVKAITYTMGATDGCYRWTDGHVQCAREP